MTRRLSHTTINEISLVIYLHVIEQFRAMLGPAIPAIFTTQHRLARVPRSLLSRDHTVCHHSWVELGQDVLEPHSMARPARGS